MKTYLIQYNISDDLAFKERIKALGAWMSYFKGFYLVESDKSAQEIYNLLAKDKQDTRILVVEIDIKNYWGWMPEEAWNWLKKRQK